MSVVSFAAAKAGAASQAAPVTGAYKTTGWSGNTDHRVSSEWFRRPSDQKFLDLDSLFNACKAEADASRADVVDTRTIEFRAQRDNAEKLEIAFRPEGGDEVIAKPTHYSFGQACSLVKAPAGYLRTLPAALSAINLQYGFQVNRGELVKSYINTETGELKALTGPDYGRIYDHELVDAIRKFAGNGTGDTMWKVPGVLTGQGYNPFVDVTKDTTTLYASDRDVFVFLVDDTHPIEIGTLPDGSPDLVFRGFYSWNSEVGDKSLGIGTLLMRGVCANRILWGTQDFEQMVIRHTKFATSRFAEEVAPALQTYATASAADVLDGINAAREKVVAKNKEAAIEFAMGLGFGKKAAGSIFETVLQEEGREPRSVWDFVQGITAHARSIDIASDRVAVERIAGKLMAKAA